MNRKPIFDAVRDMLGRPFTDEEVSALDCACEDAEGTLTGVKPSRLTTTNTIPPGARALGQRGFDLITSFEGCERGDPGGPFNAYPDPGSSDGHPWTIGWGSTGPDVCEGVTWTKQECDERFRTDIQRYANMVSKAIGDAPTTQNQFDALVSFHYNTGAIRTATLTKAHVKGDYEQAAAEFGRWVNNAGKPMKGLIRRRAAEAQLYSEA